MNSNKTIRLRTTPGESNNIQVKIEQDFDTLDILSLRITQEEAYRNFCSDYGVLVGRVIANDGFGVENAKVSIFIPISEEDQNNPQISTIYPYTTPNTLNNQGVRYNLLPKNGKLYTMYQTFQNGVDPNVTPHPFNYAYTYGGTITDPWVFTQTGTNGNIWSTTVNANYGPKTPVGTFPSKQEILDNDVLLEVYEKYYKLTTKTNFSGDYMIFGVPVGNQTVHMDVDLSDAGQASLAVDDFINAGYPQNLFSGSEFKSSTNLDSLPQIESRDISVEVVPFWGNPEQCELGITRLDFNLNKTVTPSAILIFQAFTNISGYIKKNCNIISPGMSDDEWIRISNMTKLPVSVNIEPTGSVQDKTQDFDGNVFMSIPMYQERYVTSEFGDLVPSPDNIKGIPTKGNYKVHVWGTTTHQMFSDGIDKDENTAAYHSPTMSFRYDLLNKKRTIYTVGNRNFAKDDQSNQKGCLVRGHSGGPQTNYPLSAKKTTTGGVFGESATCYGSLYFPKFQVKDNDKCGTIVGLNGGSNVYDGFEYNKLSINSFMDITDIYKYFKPFGGLYQTSAFQGFSNGQQINGFGSGSNEDEINLADHTIPFKNNLLGLTVNPTFPDRLDSLETISSVPQIVYQSLVPSSGYKTSLTGRYFIYFGLYSSDSALSYLKERLGE